MNLLSEAGRGNKGFLPRALGGDIALQTLWFGILASRHERINSCDFKPMSLWYMSCQPQETTALVLHS